MSHLVFRNIVMDLQQSYSAMHTSAAALHSDSGNRTAAVTRQHVEYNIRLPKQQQQYNQ